MRWYGVLAVLVLAAGMSAPAAAQRDRHEGARALDQILPHIRQSRPGTFYDAEGPYPGPDGRMHYRLKWMTPEGRILWLDTDAHTGRVLGEDRGPRRPQWDRGGAREDQRRYAPRRDRDDERGNPFRGHRDNDRGWGNRWNRGGDRSGRGSYDRGNHRDRNDRGGRGHRGW